MRFFGMGVSDSSLGQVGGCVSSTLRRSPPLNAVGQVHVLFEHSRAPCLPKQQSVWLYFSRCSKSVDSDPDPTYILLAAV